MFKPVGMKKILAGFDVCAYVYSDGVVILERKTIRHYGESFKKEFAHIFECDIPVNRFQYGSREFNGRLVIHNASLLIDGIERIDLYKGEETKKDTILLNTSSGMRIAISDATGDITIQDVSVIDDATVKNWYDSSRHISDITIVKHEMKKAN